MGTTIVSVVIAGLAAFLIPLAVSAAARRGDARRRAEGRLPAPDIGTLFTVRLRRWQSALIRTLSIVFIVIGVLATAGSVSVLDEATSPGPLISAVVILLVGIGGVVLASAMRRTRIAGLPDAVLWRQGLRTEQVVPLESIASITRLANAYGGIQARDRSGRRLFWSNTLSHGYGDMVAYLAERVPEQWAAYEASVTGAR